MSTQDLNQLEEVLQKAAAERQAELERLNEMDDNELAYLAGVGELEDPVTDGIEAGCGEDRA